MSSTNRGAVRDTDDHYATPPEVAALICKTLRDDGWIENPKILLEPGCGEGSFMDAFRTTWPHAKAVGIEINGDLADVATVRDHDVIHGDYLAAGVRLQVGNVDAAVGNPPFIRATEFISTALQHAGLVAFILRLNFLGSRERWETFWTNPKTGRYLAHVYVLPFRIGFTANGKTDSIEYGVFIFKPGWVGGIGMSFIDNSDTENRWRGESWHWRRSKEVSA